MSQSMAIAAVVLGSLALPAMAQQSGDPAKTPTAQTPPQSQPAPQPPPQTQPQVITPVRGKPGFGVPAALPGPIQGGFGVTPAIGVPQKNPTTIHNIPIITPPPAHSIPQAPAPNDGSDGAARLRRWVNSGNDGNIYIYDWRYMGYPDGYNQAVGGIPSLADRRYVGTWNPWGYNNGWGVPVVDVSSGNVRGYYPGNNWGMAFQLGTGFPTVNYSSYSSLDKYPSRLFRSYYAPWSAHVAICNGQLCDQNAAIYGYTDPYLVVGADKSVIVDQRLLSPGPNAPPREPTALERAEFAMRIGNAAEAVKQIKEHLKAAPDDAGVERLLAIALLDDRKTDQAIAVMLHAYTKQPQLARDPIDPYVVGSGADYDHHLRFTKVMEYANRVKTGASYLAAAVLAQSEGRLDTAKKLLDKAAAEGVDKKVADELALALASK